MHMPAQIFLSPCSLPPPRPCAYLSTQGGLCAKGLQFSKSSANLCVTPHGSYIQTRQPPPTRGTPSENADITCATSELWGKLIHLSAGAWCFLDGLHSSSNKHIPVLQKEKGGVVGLLLGPRIRCPGCWQPTLVFSTSALGSRFLKRVEHLPDLGPSNTFILSTWNSILSSLWKLNSWSSFGVSDMPLSCRSFPDHLD